MTFIPPTARKLKHLPLFAWADQIERARIRNATPMARHLSRHAGLKPVTAIAICDALGLGGEAFDG